MRRHARKLRHAGSGSEAAWLSRGAKASQATRSAEMSRPAIPNRGPQIGPLCARPSGTSWAGPGPHSWSAHSPDGKK